MLGRRIKSLTGIGQAQRVAKKTLKLFCPGSAHAESYKMGQSAPEDLAIMTN